MLSMAKPVSCVHRVCYGMSNLSKRFTENTGEAAGILVDTQKITILRKKTVRLPNKFWG